MGAAGIALLFAACSKENETDKTFDSKKEKAARLTSCALTRGTANTTGSSRSDYGAWTGTDKTLTWTGGSNPQVTFEGQYASFVRVKTSQWFIGTIALADTCAAWDDIASTIEVKNISPTYLGTAPSTGSFTPYNVVGASGTVSGSFFNLGYYGYVTGVPTVQKAIVIWKDTSTGATSSSFVSNPTTLSAPEAYVIRIYSFVPGGSLPSLTGTAYYGYQRIL